MGDLLAEAIRRMSDGDVLVEPGYASQYGRVRFFAPDEIPLEKGTMVTEIIA